jgi:hypothetical protein
MPVRILGREGSSCRRSVNRFNWLSPAIFFLLLSACSPGVNPALPNVDNVLAILGPAQSLLRIAAILGGVTLMLGGWKIYRYIVALPGFLVGGIAGAQLVHNFSQVNTLVIIGLLVGGVVGAWLALTLHDIAVFVLGAIGGNYIASIIWNLLSPGEMPLYVELIGAILGGLALSAMAKYWMMLLSAVAGATMVAWGVYGGILVIIVLFVFGLGVQYGLARSAGEDPFEEPRLPG